MKKEIPLLNKIKMLLPLKKYTTLIVFISLQFLSYRTFADDEKIATIKLSFTQTDSTKTCKALVISDNIPQKEKEVHFYVKRYYSLLPIGKAIETDENGEATVEFPMDLPGDRNGNLTVIAKIEDDDQFGTVETKSEVKWGIHPTADADSWENRSLSASREKAPMFLIVVSNLIIAVIWGTIFYVIFQIFRIKKESRLIKLKPSQNK